MISWPKNIVFFSGLIMFLMACTQTPNEEKIQNILNEITVSVEQGDFSQLGKHLHKNFRANGHMNAKQVKQMLMMYGMQHAKISINMISSKTSIDPIYSDKAKTVLSLVVTSKSKGASAGGLPDAGSVRQVNLEWRKDADWQLLKAQWSH